MKKALICGIAGLLLPISMYSKVIAHFPDLVKPYQLRMDENYVFISDQSSVFIYDIKTFKLIQKLGGPGEGPQEFKYSPNITITKNKLILSGNSKLVIYSKEFKLIKEIITHFTPDGIIPSENNFIGWYNPNLDKNKYIAYQLYNYKSEKIKEFAVVQIPGVVTYNLTNPWPECRTWDDKIFLTQPEKGFYFDVFDKNGNKLYEIKKDMQLIKSGENHKKWIRDEYLFILGRKLFEKHRKRGTFDRPLKKYLQVINHFWVMDNRIFIKTLDITDTQQKYIIMDLKGNILNTVFLPITYKECQTFLKNTFYYLEDTDEEGWVLNAVKF